MWIGAWILVIVAAACGGEAPEDVWAGTVDTLPSGTVVIHNPRQGVWEARETGWTLVEELRIGHLDMAEPELFSRVNGLLVDDLGRVFVLDRDLKRIQVFGPDGEWIRTVSREGGGPGELKDPIGMARGPEGRIWVADPGNGRYTAFDTAGEYVMAHRRPVGGYSVPWRGGFTREGTLQEIAHARFEDESASALITLGPDFELRDTLRMPEYPTEEFVLGSESFRMTTEVPFSSTREEALGPDGALWVGATGEYTIARLGPDGDTVRVIRRDAERLPVTAADRERALEGLQWFIRQGGKVDASRIPDEKPFFERFYVGEGDRVWVVRTTPADQPATRLDVFDTRGRFLGTVDFPFEPGSRTLFGEDRIWANTRDSLGVPYVVRLRIEERAETPPAG